MKITPIISIIVPIYKVEKFLRRCLKSIQYQTFPDFEVLLIDDDSPDKSAAIAKEFCRRDPRFRYFHKENGGLSDARNYGIDRAKGEYIAFIDSDDHVHRDFLKTLYEACRDNNADMAYCKFMYSYFNTGLKCPRPSKARTGVMSRDDALIALITDSMFQSYAWNKLYRTSLFRENGIRYPYMFFEDIATSSKLLHKSNKLSVSAKHLYYYEKRFGSIVGTMNAEKISDYWRSILAQRNYFESVGEYDKFREAICHFAKKAHLINIYSIIRQHVLHLDFRKMKYNLDTNRDIFRYITSDEFKAVEGLPEVPYKFVQPGRKKQERKTKKFPVFNDTES